MGRFRKSGELGHFLSPTSSCWLDQNCFAVSYSEAYVVIIDCETGQTLSTIHVVPQQQRYSGHSQKRPHIMESQINAIVASNNLMVAGTEDFKLRFIDLKSNKVVKTLIGHADAVSCLEFLGGGSNVMMSGGHDGAVRTWDLRTF